jgi:hypothetical protein
MDLVAAVGGRNENFFGGNKKWKGKSGKILSPLLALSPLKQV